MKKHVFTALVLLICTTLSFAQSGSNTEINWNYEAYPSLPFELNQVQLNIQVEPGLALIKGSGTYSLRSKQPKVTQLVFNTSNLDVKEVSSKGQKLDFQVVSDSLIINLPDTLNANERTEVLISWESTSPYGIHKDAAGHLWTSLNPQARSHWIPLPDHPEVTATFDATFTVPAELNIAFNGSLTGDEIISAETKKVRWVTENPVPVTGITFAVGNFVKESARSGVKEIALYASETVPEEVRSNLLATAVEQVKKLEDVFSFEFPYETLTIAILPDNKWEEVQAGAGIVYLYQNLGSLSTQLKRGVAAQWLGNYHRYLDAPNANYEFLKALAIASDDAQLLQNPDGLQSISAWNNWQSGIQNFENDFQKNVVKASFPHLIQQGTGVMRWSDYADYWYDKTGAFWGDIHMPSPDGRAGQDEHYMYAVEYVYDEMQNSLHLIFTAESEPVKTLIGVEVKQFGFMDTTKAEIAFTGASDTVAVPLESGVDYVTLTPVEEVKVDLNEQKPFIFLIRQLRSSNPDEQIQAAIQLRNYSDNPDLQLAVQDVLQSVTDPKVRAAFLQTLAGITQGASGTEQNFLNQLNSDNLATQVSAVKALVNYPGNEQVAYSVRNTLLRTQEDTLFDAALATYTELVETEEVFSVINSLEQGKAGQRKALKILNETISVDSTAKSEALTQRFMTGNFPYEIRKQAFQILFNHTKDEEFWEKKIAELLDDRDPRIRFYALDVVPYLSSKQEADLLNKRSKEELDPRVLHKVKEMM